LGYAEGSLVVRSGGLYGFAGNANKGGNFVQRMIGRATETDPPTPLKMVADQRLQPTFTEDLAKALVDAVERNATGVLHLVNEGAMSWYDFTVAIMENAGIDVPIEAGTTTIGPGGVDRPLNGVLARTRADELGIPKLRPVGDALQDYMSRAGLSAGATA
ncbi:MAG TPA: sugar nucleotide-binding protein, partial [Solirubrobacteraceae bacterium]